MIALIGHHHPIMANEFDRFYVHGVRYVEQADPYWCGPASLSMVLGYWGCEMNQSEIAAHVYDPESKLTFILNMTMFPRELGFQSEAITPANIERLKVYISEGIPLIVLQKFSYDNPYGHFRVVTGYDEEERMMTTYDPLLGINYTLSYKAFSDMWQPGSTFTTVNWTLVIVPLNKVLKDLMKGHQSNLNTNYTDITQRYERLKSTFNSLNASYMALMEQYNEMESKLETQSEELKNLKSFIIISFVAVGALLLTNIYTVTKLRSLRRRESQEDNHQKAMNLNCHPKTQHQHLYSLKMD